MERTLFIDDIDGSGDFKHVQLAIKKWIPKSFGYSLELSGSINLLSIEAGGKAGVNYNVITEGEFSWFPYEYVYLGYTVNTIIFKNLQYLIDKLLNLNKVKDMFKLADTGISVGVSPFVAWINDTPSNITPQSWTGWFTANTLSVNLKNGLGISFGGSLFAGADSGWSPGTNLNFVDIEEKKRWFGVSVEYTPPKVPDVKKKK